MKHYVLGFVFNKDEDRVLLIEKQNPKWQKGRWNGIGGKIEQDEKPLDAMYRETWEETKETFDFQHVLTFVCPGGTVFVYRAFSDTKKIPFEQMEKERLEAWPVCTIFPEDKIMNNLKWIIPICLSSIQIPILVQANKLGAESE